ncbi:MAG TPA: alginate export family protein [Leptospiraceae bacterium]|nr:alginate export family protein [Leptospiraceae bacterium]HMW05506.1 alginate export family protein [Leptospiraceae bacterium]HMX32467.1 alginate export family protein [Leptospiraceae bacterium]HMY31016.1 alginate export family protein [Leptospiraceae bacterium]HMZ65050.1 alginate export family protein [Leptospiraceae bacterium]
MIKSINSLAIGGLFICFFTFGISSQEAKKTAKDTNPTSKQAKDGKEAKETGKEAKDAESSPSFNLDPPAEVKYEEQPNDGKGIPEIQAELAKEEPYKSPMKGKLSGDFLRSMLLSPEHQDAVRKVDRLWFGDIFRIGFQARPRLDYSFNRDFDKRTQDGTNFGTQNSQVWFAIDPTPNVSAKVTIQDVRVWGGDQSRKDGQLGYLGLSNSAGIEVNSTPSSTNVINIQNRTGIREGFIVLKNYVEGLEFTIGRQVLGFGDNRYIGGRNDGQTGNSFDGVKAKYAFNKMFSTEAFTSILAEESNGGGGNNTSNGQRKGTVNDTYLSGLYNTLKFEDFLIDLYLFNIDRKWEQSITTTPPTSMDRTRQRDDLNTAGFRITNRTNNNILPKFKSWDWTVESSMQFGNTGVRVNADWDVFQIQAPNGQRLYSQRQEYDSRFFLAQTGYTFFDRFRVGIQYSVGTGDNSRSDSRMRTFDASFATRSGGFPYFDSGAGITNTTFWSNTRIKSLHLMWNTEKLGRWIGVIYDTQKDQVNDAWYSSGGTPNTGLSYENTTGGRFGGSNTLGQKIGKHLFYEYNLIWQYYLKDYVSIWAGASYLTAGDSIRGVRVNPLASDATARYSLDNKSYSFFLFVQFAM